MKNDEILSISAGDSTIASSGSSANNSTSRCNSPSDSTNNRSHHGEFEIRVALIGYVSVGKTMILNALLKDKYSEVSMQRATAGVNHFRISYKSGTTHQHEVLSSARATLEETTSDNQKLRNCDYVEQKTFDIELDEPLFEMRPDTKLVIIDVPGINEAGVSKKYKDYVSNHWHTFDCVVVVLDGRQGVNTDEQVDLLTLAQRECQKVKNLRLIVLLNKVDDPDDEEQQVLVKEATQAIERMFKVSDQEGLLKQIVSGKANKNTTTNKNTMTSAPSPIVIPISAVYAFVYRAAASLDLERFKAKIDINLIEKLGKEAYGRRWKKFAPQDKLKKAFEVIQDDDQYEDGLEQSRFTHFLKALSFCVGGAGTQKRLIEEQIKVHTRRLRTTMDFVAELKSIYDKSQKLEDQKSIHAGDLAIKRFMQLFKQSYCAALTKFEKDGPKQVGQLAKPIADLVAFCDLLKHMDRFDTAQASKIVNMGKQLVLKQVEAVLSMEEKWKDNKLTSFDAILICGAMLGPARKEFFDEHFGLARVLLEKKFQDACRGAADPAMLENCETCGGAVSRHSNSNIMDFLYCSRCLVYFVGSSDHRSGCKYCSIHYQQHSRTQDPNGKCSYCGYTQRKIRDPLQHQLSINKLVLKWPEKLESSSKVEVTDSPRNPKHFGHLIWRFGKLLAIASSVIDDDITYYEESETSAE
ncbi:hypothetical protein ACA910_002224 [Epithemia clementina (nom. ined.)]